MVRPRGRLDRPPSIQTVNKPNFSFRKIYLAAIYMPFFFGCRGALLRCVETKANPVKVLIVEDNDIVSDCLETILRAYGYDPLCAATPDQAVAHCQREQCDIFAVIADVRLGKFRGFETAVLLKKLCPDMNVIFTSGAPYGDLVGSGLLPEQLGSATFLQKPFLASDVKTSLQLLRQASKPVAMVAKSATSVS